MTGRKYRVWLMRLVAAGCILVAALGCWATPSAHTISRNYSLRDIPVDPPPQQGGPDSHRVGGQIFKMYCGSCHNARALGERPFSNYEVAAAHMREQAYLTGAEYRELIHFLRRWHDVGQPTPDAEPSPKRFFFSQPISELRDGKAEPKPGKETPAPSGTDR